MRAPDGRRLRAALFQPPGRPRGSVVVSPGRTEFIEKYFEVVVDLQGRGFTVLVHDWRGQGLSDRLLSDRLRGHAAGLDPFIHDFRSLLDAFEGRLPRPWLSLAHSMGAALTTLAMAAGEGRFAGALLTAPMFGLDMRGAPVAVARTTAWTMARCGRGGDYVAGAEPPGGARLSHDPVREGRWRAMLEVYPDLRLGGVTWGWLDMALEATSRLARDPGLSRIETLVTAVAAGADNLVDGRAIRAVVSRIPNSRFLEVEGGYHELLMETDPLRDQVWTAFDRMAEEVMPPPG